MAELPKSWKNLSKDDDAGTGCQLGSRVETIRQKDAHVSDGSALSLWNPRRRQSLIWPP